MTFEECLKKIALQCSQYEEGARWCDFCNFKIDMAKPLEGHNPACPVYILKTSRYSLAREVYLEYMSTLFTRYSPDPNDGYLKYLSEKGK